MSNSKGKSVRASTSSKNRTARSPSPYRTTQGTTPSEFVNEFWQHTITTAENSEEDFKHQALPLARIKKVMKSDPEVKMISSEVTILFEKACQIFIQEITARSHLVSLSSRRRTLSRPDVAQAVAKSDMFDFLIDIIPREESSAAQQQQDDSRASSSGPSRKGKGKGKATAVGGPEVPGPKKRSRIAAAAEDGDENYSENGSTQSGAAEDDEDSSKRPRYEGVEQNHFSLNGAGLQWAAAPDSFPSHDHSGMFTTGA